MKKIILICALLCSLVSVNAQDANKKGKNNVATTQRSEQVVVPAPAIEPAQVLTIDASAVRDANAHTMMPAMGGTITIDARQTQSGTEQKNKVQQAPAQKK